jgi:glycosyltransferase involved in cell wall biosynthesis
MQAPHVDIVHLVPWKSAARRHRRFRELHTVVFVNEAHTVPTRRPAFLIQRNPPPIRERYRAFAVEGTRELTLIATSRYAAALWAEYLDVDVATISIVYPFAEPGFAAQPRPVHEAGETRVLFAGRLSPEKGIYTLLETLHLDIIERLLDAHPGISVVGRRKTPAAMAALMARHDIVVIPSNRQYWHETFGIVSIEAQHAGCRIVASDDGGLPETDCGAVTLVRPDDAEVLACGIIEAADRGPVSAAARNSAGARFTVGQSVDSLLDVFTPAAADPARRHRQAARRADRGAVGHGDARSESERRAHRLTGQHRSPRPSSVRSSTERAPVRSSSPGRVAPRRWPPAPTRRSFRARGAGR